MTRIGTLQGTYLGIYQAKVCEYWTAKPQKRNCKFCSVGLNLGVDDADEKSVDEVMEVVRARARRVGHHLRGLQHRPLRGRHLPRHPRALRACASRRSWACWSASRRRRTATCALRRACARWASTASRSASRSSTAALFEEICPGKHAEYGLDHYLEAIRYCAALGSTGPRHEPWVTNGEIIAGLEPPESSIRAIDWITSVGAIPTVCVFRPLVGTDLADARAAADRGHDPRLPAPLRSLHGARACRSAARRTST